MKKYINVIIINVLLISGIYADSLWVIPYPSARSYSRIVYDSVNQRMILFGGMIGYYEFCNEVWALDCAQQHWYPISPAGTAPAPRIESAVAYDAANNRMIVFGGYGDYHFNDVWALDLTMGREAWNVLTTTGAPSPRTGLRAICDPVNNRFIFFGGNDGQVTYNETWSLNLNTLTWSQLHPAGKPPSPRWAHSAVYDSKQHRMIIFAGSNYYEPMSNDVWTLDLTYGSEAWERLSPGGSLPGLRAQHFCAFDNGNSEMIIGFGYDYPSWIHYNDIWVLNLDPLVWRRIFPQGTGIEGRRAAAAAFDPLGKQTFIFGGNQYNTDFFNDTYGLKVDAPAIEDYNNSPVTYPYVRLSSNPSRLPVHVHIFIPFPSTVALEIFDISGRFITALIKGRRASGNYRVRWDGVDDHGNRVVAGTYFIALDINGNTVAKKAVVIE